MRKIFMLITIACLTSPAVFAASKDKAPSSDLDKVSYSLGVKTGENFQGQSIEINPAEFFKGLTDAINKRKFAMTDKEMEATMTKFQEQHMTKMIAKEKEAATTNLAKSDAFLKKNKSKKGVETTSSGLQYEVLQAGSGSSPSKGDTVTVNYRGTLLDGTEFDSSYKNSEPSTFPLDNLITGWQEALLLMQPGAKWKIYVPPTLAYGEQGAGNVIEPNSTLIFEIELVNVAPRS